MKLGWIFGLVAALCLSAQAYGADWELVTRDGREYVTLKSFCDFYHFQHPGLPSGDVVRLKNQQFSVSLKFDSRETYINGTHYWLSFPIRQAKQDWLISRVDLVKLYEPLLRPYRIDIRRPVGGVIIDAGHGGSDNGAISARRVMEKDLTLDTALRLEKILREAGIKTVMTRRSDVYVDLYERAQRAAAFPDYIFVSIHFNSAAAGPRGLETYCCSPRGAGSTQSGGAVSRADYQKLPNNDMDPLNILLAGEIHRVAAARLNPNDPEADRGVKRARFVVLRQNTAPSVLIEGGFLSNRMEAAALTTVAYRQKLAESIARGIQNYAAIMLPPEKRVTPPQVRLTEPPKPATTTAAPAAAATTSPATAPAPATAPPPAPATTRPAAVEPSPDRPAHSPPAPPAAAASTEAAAPDSTSSEITPTQADPTATPTPATAPTPATTPSLEQKHPVTAPQPEPPTTIYEDHNGAAATPEPDQP